MTGGLTDHGDRWTVPLTGCKVDRIAIDYQFRLQFLHAPGSSDEGAPGFEITIETAFVYSAPGGRTWRIDPAQPTALGPALALLHEEVENAVVWKDGRLAIGFAGGHRLAVPPDASYEAWQLGGGPDGLLLVCAPGGGEPALWSS